MRDYGRVETTVSGLSALIMHNGRLADPLDEWAKKLKKLTAKKSKTDDDHELIGEVEWEASMYWTEGLGIYLPSMNIARMLLDAAKKIKLGRQTPGILVENEVGFKVEHRLGNTRGIEKMRKDPEYRYRCCAGVAGRKIMRTRFRVPAPYTVKFTVLLDYSLLDLEQFREIVAIAGHQIGWCDQRPGSPKVPGPYGRFGVEAVQELALDSNEQVAA